MKTGEYLLSREVIRQLSSCQQKVLLAVVDLNLPNVKEVSKHCFISHQTASAILFALKQKNIVISEKRGRESLWQVSSPLIATYFESQRH